MIGPVVLYLLGGLMASVVAASIADDIPLSTVTPVGMLVLVAGLPYLQMARGKLVPRSSLDDVIHDRDEWRAAHRISETARQVAADQVEELLEHARTTDMFIRALPNPRGGGPP